MILPLFENLSQTMIIIVEELLSTINKSLSVVKIWKRWTWNGSWINIWYEMIFLILYLLFGDQSGDLHIIHYMSLGLDLHACTSNFITYTLKHKRTHTYIKKLKCMPVQYYLKYNGMPTEHMDLVSPWWVRTNLQINGFKQSICI